MVTTSQNDGQTLEDTNERKMFNTTQLLNPNKAFKYSNLQYPKSVKGHTRHQTVGNNNMIFSGFYSSPQQEIQEEPVQ